MSEYIKREDAELIAFKSPFFSDALMEEMKAIPAADVVPVVRCKDCKYNKGDNKCLNPNSIIKVPSDFDYCSYGEKK